ncbi:MAG: hypothetical protein ACOX9R_06375 [Armatimonadota bacterium]
MPEEMAQAQQRNRSPVSCVVLLVIALGIAGLAIWSAFALYRQPVMRGLLLDGTRLSRAELEDLTRTPLPDGVEVEHAWLVGGPDVILFAKLAVPRAEVSDLTDALPGRAEVSHEDRLDEQLRVVEGYLKADWWRPDEVEPPFTAARSGGVWIIIDDLDRGAAEAYLQYTGG